MFRAKAKPGNICFSRPDLGLNNIKDMSICVHECVRITKFQEGISERES